jgi:hypothetical protein
MFTTREKKMLSQTSNRLKRSLPLDLASVDETESGAADHLILEKVPFTPDEVLKKFFRKLNNSLQSKS